MEEKTIGELISERIKLEGRTHTWVCDQIGLSKSSLSQRIHGKIEFRFSEIEKIEKIFPNVTKNKSKKS